MGIEWGRGGQGADLTGFWHQLQRQAAPVGLIMQKMPNKVFNVVNLTTSSAFFMGIPLPPSHHLYIRVRPFPFPLVTGIFPLFQLLTKAKQQQRQQQASIRSKVKQRP